MEGIKKLAKARYERASKEEKDSAGKFFKRMDKNRDGKVSLRELESTKSPWLSDDKVFKKLDVNGDGALDFDEVLALRFMMEEEGRILKCGGCADLLVGPYFSCHLCLDKSPKTYDLCCDCYGEGKFKHEHSSSNFLDHHSLLRMFRNQEQKTKKAMEELREIAKAHYRAGSADVQAKARDFFESMDNDRDKRIDLSEFLAFMKEQGYDLMRNRPFFEVLDRDGNGTLDFWEVMTVYYIIKSGRPFCDSCWNFIPGIFFSCVECPESSFTLCLACYSSEKCIHNHNRRAHNHNLKRRTQFLDNYTLLQVRRDSPQKTGIKTPPDATQRTDNKASTSAVVVPAPRTEMLEGAGLAFKALEIAITAITIGGAAGCTIL